MPPIRRQHPDITPEEQQAAAIEDAAQDGCITCRQTKAEKLTAVAIGIAFGNIITEATGDASHLEEAARLAANGDWVETDKVVYAAFQHAYHRGENRFSEHRDSALRNALSFAEYLHRDAEFAVSNLEMAHECLDGTFKEEDDGYTAAKHLRNCQTMALSAACTLLWRHPQALQMGQDIAEAQCPHTQGREWTKRERVRIQAQYAPEALNAPADAATA